MIEIMKASAGSGKTYNLAGKYMDLLLKNDDRHAYRHILAVTFTNKATDEMKSRILMELHVLATHPERSGYHDRFVPALFPSDEDLKKKAETVLCDILHDYSAFAVSTIDRFFQQTLKAFSREIGHFASYQVELDKDSLVAESVDRILDSLTEDNDGLLPWLTDNVLEQIEQGGRYSMDANLVNMAVRLKSSQRHEALEAAGIDENETYTKDKLLEIRNRCRKIIADFKSEIREKASRALAVIHEAGVDPSDSYRHFLCALYRYSELDEKDTVEAPTETFLTCAADSEKWFAKAKAKVLLPKVYPFLEAPLEDFCRLFQKDFDVYNTACILDSQLYGLGVAAELEDTFNELMKEKNVLCIDDSNTILRDIIDGSDAPFVYEKTGVRYDHYLLDEFQDTARVQWQNFSPLLKESESRGGENLIVGDVKQSIYRWRGSDWKLLQSAVPAEFPEHSQRVLDTNYRSLPDVVHFNNSFFEACSYVLDVMSGYEGGKGQISQIYSDVQQKASCTDGFSGNVSLTFCQKDAELQKVLDGIMEACERGARLSEIAVLVRSNAIGESISSFLIDNGIPVVTDDSLKVKSSITVRRIVSLMSHIDNPEDTVGSFLAESLDVDLPMGCRSLTDMAEGILRSLCESDAEGVWKGEMLHIQSFMDKVTEYVNSNGNSLRGFLKFWNEDDSSISSPSSGESVRVMTIHKSKGLAFPYVIIPFVEKTTVYKSGSYWCSPSLEGTSLEGVAEGVYDVTLSGSSESTLFAEDYRKERFLQLVDNMNIIYVAMTRPALGMHLISAMPSAKALSCINKEEFAELSDFSQILYWFVAVSGKLENISRKEEDGMVRFDYGDIVDFDAVRKPEKTKVAEFPIRAGWEFPSIPLNVCDEGEDVDVRERGRLKYSADSIDFFSENGAAGIAASKRIKGVVLHEIMSGITVPEDLETACLDSLEKGDLSVEEYGSAVELLSDRLIAARSRGWFSDTAERVLNEVTLIDTDGEIYRPDRVEIMNGKVLIIDYKFGEHHRKYERQLRKYADIWIRMGYAEVSAVLWYVFDDKVISVV